MQMRPQKTMGSHWDRRRWEWRRVETGTETLDPRDRSRLQRRLTQPHTATQVRLGLLRLL